MQARGPLGSFVAGLPVGYQLGLQTLEMAERRKQNAQAIAMQQAREERLARLQEQQTLAQQFGQLTQIGKAPRPLRKPLFDAWAQQYQQLTGQAVNPETQKAWQAAISDDETWQGMMQSIGEVLTGNVDQINVRTFAPLFEENPLEAMKFFSQLNEQAQFNRAMRQESEGYGRLPTQEAQAPPGLPPALGEMAGPTRYRAAIEAASQRHGVPVPILTAVGQIESNFNPRAVSPKGAQGVMQIMPGTGQELGLQQPFDAEQNINAGAQYLAQMFRRFGNWPDALAAYNAGPGRVAAGGPLPSETQGYTRRVLGLAGQLGRALGPAAAEAGTGAGEGALRARMEALDRRIDRFMQVPGVRAKGIVDQLQQERQSVQARLNEQRQLRTEARQERESILNPEVEAARVRIAQAEGQAKADVALENLRYTPQQQTQLQTLNDTLVSVETINDFSDEQIRKWVGILTNPAQRAKQLVSPDPEFLEFQNTVDQLRAGLLFSRTEGGGGALTATELKALEGFIPTGRETGGVTQIRVKLNQLSRRLQTKLSTIEGLARAKPGQAGELLRQRREEARGLRRDLRQGVEVVPGVTVRELP